MPSPSNTNYIDLKDRTKEKPNPNTNVDAKVMGQVTHLEKDPFEWSPVTESATVSRTPRAVYYNKLSGEFFFLCITECIY